MGEKTSTMRLRAPIRVFRAVADHSVADNFAAAARCIQNSTVGGAVMTGWAVVAWSHDEVFVNYENGPASRVPASGLPRHVSDILLAEQAVRWSR